MEPGASGVFCRYSHALIFNKALKGIPLPNSEIHIALKGVRAAPIFSMNRSVDRGEDEFSGSGIR